MKKTYIRPTSTAIELNLVNVLAASTGDTNNNLNWDAGNGTGVEVKDETSDTDLGEIG